MKNQEKVQKLLCMTFESEKKYFEAAQEVQIVALARFLNYQSSRRNKFANELIEALTFNNIKPLMTYVEKGTYKQSGLDTKLDLENIEYIPMLIRCLDFDQDIIDSSALLLRDESLPVDIAELLTREMTHLVFQQIEGSEIIGELNRKDKMNKESSKVIRLKNNTI